MSWRYTPSVRERDEYSEFWDQFTVKESLQKGPVGCEWKGALDEIKETL